MYMTERQDLSAPDRERQTDITFSRLLWLLITRAATRLLLWPMLNSELLLPSLELCFDFVANTRADL